MYIFARLFWRAREAFVKQPPAHMCQGFYLNQSFIDINPPNFINFDFAVEFKAKILLSYITVHLLISLNFHLVIVSW